MYVYIYIARFTNALMFPMYFNSSCRKFAGFLWYMINACQVVLGSNHFHVIRKYLLNGREYSLFARKNVQIYVVLAPLISTLSLVLCVITCAFCVIQHERLLVCVWSVWCHFHGCCSVSYKYNWSDSMIWWYSKLV